MKKIRNSKDFPQPSDTAKLIRGKARLYLILWSVFLAVGGGIYLSSTFAVVTYPTLLSIAQMSPVSFELTLNSHASSLSGSLEHSTVFINIFSFMKVLSPLVISLGMGAFILTRNFATLIPVTMLAGAFYFMPTVFEVLGLSESSVAESSPSFQTIEFGDYVKSGDIKGYLNAIERYSIRAGLIVDNIIESKTVNQDDVNNLLDVFPHSDALNVSIGLAETLANASGKGREAMATELSVAAALTAYVYSSVNAEFPDHRTGYAVYDAAKRAAGFKRTNVYADLVTQKIVSQTKLKNFLLNVAAISFGLCLFFFWLWFFSFRNVHRAERASIENDKLQMI